MHNTQNRLWTRDFTILTIGSIISILGNSASGYAMSLMVLDYTGSTLYFSIYMAVNKLPSLLIPILSGPLLDRFSRKRVIYVLDFTSAAVYLGMAVVLGAGFFNFALFAVTTFLVGCIDGIYQVAYSSFYPLLITPGNYDKAYSISSTLSTLSIVMMPLSVLIYNTLGIAWLFGFNALTFFAAACFETQIRTQEQYILDRAAQLPRTLGGMLREFRADFQEGMQYLAENRGLLCITVYYLFVYFAAASDSSLGLPFIKDTYPNGDYWFTAICGANALGRVLGGVIQYKVTYPARSRYAIAFAVYLVILCMDGFYLYTGIPVMIVLMVFSGFLNLTATNFMTAATQSYVPDEKKGRFNGMFHTVSALGALVGRLAAGTLAEFLPGRVVISIFFGIAMLAAAVLIGGNRKYVRPIFNQQV